MTELRCNQCGYMNETTDLSCKCCGYDLADAEKFEDSISIKTGERNNQSKSEGKSNLWYAIAIIVPNAFIQILQYNGATAFAIGSCVGTIVMVTILCGIAYAITNRVLKNSEQKTRDYVNVISAYIVYGGLMIVFSFI